MINNQAAISSPKSLRLSNKTTGESAELPLYLQTSHNALLRGNADAGAISSKLSPKPNKQYVNSGISLEMPSCFHNPNTIVNRQTFKNPNFDTREDLVGVRYIPKNSVDIFRMPEYKIGEPEDQWSHKVKKKILPAVRVYDCVNNQEKLVPRPSYYTKETSDYERNYKNLYKNNSLVFYRKNGPFSSLIDNSHNQNLIFIKSDPPANEPPQHQASHCVSCDKRMLGMQQSPSLPQLKQVSTPQSSNWYLYQNLIRHQAQAPPSESSQAGSKINKNAAASSKLTPATNSKNIFHDLFNADPLYNQSDILTPLLADKVQSKIRLKTRQYLNYADVELQQREMQKQTQELDAFSKKLKSSVLVNMQGSKKFERDIQQFKEQISNHP